MSVQRVTFLTLLATVITGAMCTTVYGQQKRDYVVSERLAREIEKAAPDRPIVKPARPRRLLVYGRVPTHPESVACCFKAMEILGSKTGAFEAVSSGDPVMFLPENLERFDAVLMNNTHERTPMLPFNIEQLDGEAQNIAREREATLKKSLLDFVANGRGIVGIHGAVAGGVRWPEYLEMLAGQYGGHFTDQVWVKPVEPNHPLCAALRGESFQVHDEIYMFREPYSREKVRVLLRLDLSKMPDPGKRDDGDYVVSWVRPHGKGRVFYCSLGHVAGAYTNRHVMQHYLAGIQFAIGDLEADASLK
jgi:type 1 glutamine amidotransferase